MTAFPLCCREKFLLARAEEQARNIRQVRDYARVRARRLGLDPDRLADLAADLRETGLYPETCLVLAAERMTEGK